MPEQTDAFACAYGSEAAAKDLVSTDARARCPACGHLALMHNLNDGGTCDVCRSGRLVTNALVEAAQRGGRALRPPICPVCGGTVCQADCQEALANGWPTLPPQDDPPPPEGFVRGNDRIKARLCTACNGSGSINTDSGAWVPRRKCPVCDGQGLLPIVDAPAPDAGE